MTKSQAGRDARAAGVDIGNWELGIPALRPPRLFLEAREDHAGPRWSGGPRSRIRRWSGRCAAAVVHHDHRPVIEIGDPLVVLLPLFQHVDAHVLARQDHGRSALVNSLMFRTPTPWSSADLVEVEVVGHDLGVQDLGHGHQLVVDFADLGNSMSLISTRMSTSFWIFLQDVQAAPPRLRFSGSDESAMCCNSRRMNCGMTSVPSRNPVSVMSAMRPSMMTEVSRSL